MNLREARLRGKGPFARLRSGASGSSRAAAFRRSIQRKNATHTIVVPTRQTEEVRERDLAPVYFDLGRLQTGRGARDIAAHRQRTGRLQRYAAAPWLSFQLQAPAAGRDLLYAAGNSQKCER